jgi:hypothetical protein
MAFDFCGFSLFVGCEKMGPNFLMKTNYCVRRFATNCNFLNPGTLIVYGPRVFVISVIFRI